MNSKATGTFMTLTRGTLILLALAGVASAGTGADPAVPRFLTRTVDGKSHTAPLERIDDNWALQLLLDAPLRLGAEEVLWLRRAGATLPDLPAAEHLVLANGDRVVGRIQKVSGEKVQVRVELAAERFERSTDWTLALSAVRAVWFAPPENDPDPDLLRRRLAVESRRRDAVLLRNGDLVEGSLTGLDRSEPRASVRLEVDRKETSVELANVAAIALNTDLMQRVRPRGVHGRVVLSNGSRLTLASAVAENGILRGETVWGTAVRVALADLVHLHVHNGRSVFLSDLKPRRYEYRPYLGNLNWPYVADGSVAGRELRLGGNVFDRGLGLHSGARITYALDGAYRRFEALVGLDDRTGKNGSARIAVAVDGKEADLGVEGDLTWKGGPRAVRVDTAGARELTLVVDYGRFADVQDHVNWADAQLVK